MIRLVNISITGIGNGDALSLADEVLKIEGVIKATARIEDAIIEVKYDHSLVQYNFIKDTIESTGCQVV